MERIDKYVWYQEGPGVRKKQKKLLDELIKSQFVENAIFNNLEVS